VSRHCPRTRPERFGTAVRIPTGIVANNVKIRNRFLQNIIYAIKALVDLSKFIWTIDKVSYVVTLMNIELEMLRKAVAVSHLR
jgi:hypothetical protein